MYQSRNNTHSVKLMKTAKFRVEIDLRGHV
jgi:hypothetical protein